MEHWPVVFGILCGLIGVLAGVVGNFYSAFRLASSYRALLKADLEILEKAEVLKLDTTLARARVQRALDKRHKR